MKAKVNSVEVEGTPEEIDKLLGIAIKETDVKISCSVCRYKLSCGRLSNGEGPCEDFISKTTRKDLDISDDILTKAVKNTVKILKAQIKVIEQAEGES